MREKLMRKKKMIIAADFLLLIVAAIWGGGFVAGKIVLSEMNPLAVLFYRFCGSAVILGIPLFHKIKKADKNIIKCGMILGFLQFAGLLVQLFALQYTTPAKQAFLASAYVVLTPLVSWAVLKIIPAPRDGAAMILALAGIGLISLNRTLTVQIGDPLTLLFALIFSLQIVLTGKYVKHNDAMLLTFFQFFSSGILSAVVLLISGTELGFEKSATGIGLFYLVFINTALALCLQNIAQNYSKPGHTALLLSLESVFGFLFSVWIYKEKVTIQIIAGCILVFTAILTSKGILVKRPIKLSNSVRKKISE